MHSTVRRLAFGPEDRCGGRAVGTWVVYSMPDEFALGTRMLLHAEVGRVASVYGVHQTGRIPRAA
jgi:hypothetical protein